MRQVRSEHRDRLIAESALAELREEEAALRAIAAEAVLAEAAADGTATAAGAAAA